MAYTASEVPTILLVIYSIVSRILWVLLIRKEDLLSFIPARTIVGSLIARIIARYFYAILIGAVGLMILSDPHIGGYNNLISYLLFGILGTLVVIPVLFFLYNFCRRTLLFTFFSSDGEILKERFNYAKAVYATSLSSVFIVFFILGVVLVLLCWGKFIPTNELFDFFSRHIIRYYLDGQSQKLSLLKII